MMMVTTAITAIANDDDKNDGDGIDDNDLIS